MKVEFTAEAEQAVEEMDAWWREHRRASPALFADELVLALSNIREQPNVPAVHSVTGQGVVRRVLMPKTRSHVYYVYYPEQQLARIISVWGGPRGAGPKL